MKNKIISIIFLIAILVSLLGFVKVAKAADEEIGNETGNSNTTTGGNETDGSDIKTEEDLTDFSNINYELKNDGFAGALIEITGINYDSYKTYSLYISDKADKPDISNIEPQEKVLLDYDKNEKKFITIDKTKIAGIVETNQDIYANFIVYNSSAGKDEVVSYGKKVERYEENKYSDAFNNTFMTYEATQIVTNFTHNTDNNRKIQIRVGKIADKTILNKIKQQETSGFADLLNYSKSNSAIFDETLDANKNDPFIDYNGKIALTGLENGQYYYLYIKTDEENGKYKSNEAVTLAQASVYDGGWSMFFYGTGDFTWADFNNNNNNNPPIEDISISPAQLPRTGSGIIKLIIIMSTFAGAGFISYKGYRKYMGI